MKNNLKQIRTEIGMTQEQLAMEIGSSKSYISQLESGNRDINNIRSDTLIRLCGALSCTPKDLIRSVEMSFDEQGHLIVDGLYYDPRYNGHIIKINDSYYKMNGESKSGLQAAALLQPLPRYVCPENMEELTNLNYLLLHLVPRNGYAVSIGRHITESEIEEIKGNYGITEEDISNEFLVKAGSVYGNPYEKIYSAIQVQFDQQKTNSLEAELMEKKIEFDTISPGRVNIRIKRDRRKKLFGYKREGGKLVPDEIKSQIVKWTFEKMDEYSVHPPKCLVESIMENDENLTYGEAEKLVPYESILMYVTEELNSKCRIYEATTEGKDADLFKNILSLPGEESIEKAKDYPRKKQVRPAGRYGRKASVEHKEIISEKDFLAVRKKLDERR